MHSDDPKSDAEIVALAKAERDAGVPDVQTAEAAAEIEKRTGDADAGDEPHSP